MSDWRNDGPSNFTAQWLRDDAYRRPPLIDFSELNRGGSSGGYSGGGREPARLSDVLMTVGLFLGLSVLLSGVLLWKTSEMLLAPLAGGAVAAPFFLAAWVLRLVSKTMTGGRAAGPLAVLARWTMIGAATGLSLGSATPVLLGADISVWEGLRVFAPAGLALGLAVGLIRAATRRKQKVAN